MKADILLICVIYNSYFEAERYIDSLKSFINKEIDLIVVDNSSIKDDFFEQKLLQFSSNIQFLKLDMNVGYFGGVRAGISFFNVDLEKYKFTIISNVDLEIKDKHFFKKLHDLSQWNDVGVLAPSIISMKKKQDLNPKYISKPSRKKMKFLNFIFSSWIVLNLYELLSNIKFYSKKYLKSERQVLNCKNEIYAAHGSFIILSSNYFLKGGTLNTPSFLFGEEIFLAEECQRLNLKIVHTPALSVVDHEHASTGIFRSYKIASYMRQSVKDILNLYYS